MTTRFAPYGVQRNPTACFAFVRLALLTGQRKEKVASIQWDDIDGAVWHIPSEEREKGNAGDLELPQMALDIINAHPRFASNPFVFAGRKGHCLASVRARRHSTPRCRSAHGCSTT
jgi:integrase